MCVNLNIPVKVQDENEYPLLAVAESAMTRPAIYGEGEDGVIVPPAVGFAEKVTDSGVCERGFDALPAVCIVVPSTVTILIVNFSLG